VFHNKDFLHYKNGNIHILNFRKNLIPLKLKNPNGIQKIHFQLTGLMEKLEFFMLPIKIPTSKNVH